MFTLCVIEFIDYGNFTIYMDTDTSQSQDHTFLDYVLFRLKAKHKYKRAKI